MSYLSNQLQDAIDNKIGIIDHLLSLKDYSFDVKSNAITMICSFGWQENYLEQLNPEIFSFHYSLELSFYKLNNVLFCAYSKGISEELNE